MPFLIVGGIVLLLALLLLARVRLQITWNERFQFKIKYLFFVYRMKEKKKGKAKTKEKQPGNRGVSGFVKNFKTVFDMLEPAFKALSRRARVDRLSLELVICEEDAARTALEYGEACAVIFPAEALLENFLPVRRKEIRITPVFGGTQSGVSFFFVLSVSLFAAVAAASSAALTMVRKKARKSQADGDPESRPCGT